MTLAAMTKEQLVEYQNQLNKEYADYKAKGLALNMARGKPAVAQLDLSMDMLDIKPVKSANGTDIRNYGIVDGIQEAKELMGAMMGMAPENVIVFGNASLNIMYDMVVRALLFGVSEEATPWIQQGKLKFLCPSPGYDRHFGVTEQLGFELITVEMTDEGPNMDQVEELVANDASIKGIWCVPMYSNPTGITFSDDVVRRLANMKTAADDFRIFWDNAYCVHHLDFDDTDKLLNLYDECVKAGNEDRMYTFASTSKITFPGAGVAAFASSPANVAYTKKLMGAQTIGHDKMNQLRHTTYFGGYEGLLNHMKKHAAIMKPKFDAVIATLEKELGDLDICSWTNPKGGYFISFDTMPGCAKRVVGLCKEAGVTLTGAGATFPYKKDPEDKNIRLAPSLPPVEELQVAADLFCLCVKMASVEKLLAE